MRTDFPYIFRSVLLGLAMASAMAALVWVGTASWNVAGGAFLVALYAAAPVAAWLVDRAMPG